MRFYKVNGELVKKIAAVFAVFTVFFLSARAQEASPGFDREAYSQLCQCIKKGKDINALEMSVSLKMMYLVTAAQKKRQLRAQILPIVYRMIEETPDALVALVKMAAKPDLCSHEAAEILCELDHANCEAIETLIDLLEDKNESVRIYAAKALERSEAIAALAQALKPNRNCIAIIDILGRLGQKAAPALPELVDMLEREDVLSAAAVTALGQIGIADRDAVSRLLEFLQTGSREFRVKSAIALGQMKAIDAVQALAKTLSDKDKTLRENARWALAQIGKDSVCAMIELLKGDCPKLKIQACIVLGKIGKKAKKAAPDILQALRLGSPKIRATAAWAIVMVGADEQALSALIDALADDNHYVRENATRALSSLCTSQLALRALLKALNSPVACKRANAAWVLGNMHIERVKIGKRLQQSLKDPDPQVRASAIYSLGNLEIKDEKLLAAMISLLDDPERQVRNRAISALISSGKPAVSHLVALMSSEKKRVRYGASCALCEMGTLAYQALPDFVKALSDPDLRVRCNAAAAIGHLGILARSAVVPLILSLKDPAPEMRMCTAWALGLLAPFNRDSIKNALVAARDDEKDPKTRRFIVSVLQKIAEKQK